MQNVTILPDNQIQNVLLLFQLSLAPNKPLPGNQVASPSDFIPRAFPSIQGCNTFPLLQDCRPDNHLEMLVIFSRILSCPIPRCCYRILDLWVNPEGQTSAHLNVEYAWASIPGFGQEEGNTRGPFVFPSRNLPKEKRHLKSPSRHLPFVPRENHDQKSWARRSS